jgi:hypothetical protein
MGQKSPRNMHTTKQRLLYTDLPQLIKFSNCITLVHDFLRDRLALFCTVGAA